MATKTKVLTDAEIRKESFLPVAERREIIPGRKIDGEVQMRKARRYALKPGELKELRKEAGGDFPNPFRSGGVYHGAVQALINLGLDKAHTFAQFKAEMKKVMSKIERQGTDAWSLFANRAPKKDAKNPKDLDGRIMQTVTVLQRLGGNHKYGLKLAQLKSCIDVLAGKDEQPLYMLHTGFKEARNVKPTNDLKGHRRKVAKKKAPKKTFKKTAKPAAVEA
ncbi:MAG: hypothetical protein HOG49_20475 [Candidatus Scalindua sp.]|jgi:hypothetical protein|nr:hypothetical protein [Candidatus Scalindua sp.]